MILHFVSRKSDIFLIFLFIFRTISELEAQLDYERLRREKLEAQLDQYRREIADLKYEVQARTYGSDQDVSNYLPCIVKSTRFC